eukprot:jgi/Mesen1/6418/ME000329S05591
MYRGDTGEPVEALIMVGPTYYHRLKHLARDKLTAHGRTGKVHPLTKQPHGDGALQFGEMEVHCALRQGAAAFLQQRMLDLSDKCIAHVCQQCGQVATPQYASGSAPRLIHARCGSCRRRGESGGDVVQVAPPGFSSFRHLSRCSVVA